MTEQIEMPEESLAPRGAGPQLRLAREKMGLSVKDVAEQTRISQSNIEKIEAGDFAALPGRTYAMGFARSFAKVVELDQNDIAAMVRAELNAYTPEHRDARETFQPGDPTRAPSGRLVWFSIIALLILMAGLFTAYPLLFSPAAEQPSLVESQEAADAAALAAASENDAAAADPSGAVVFTSTEPGVWVRFYDGEGRRLMEKEMDEGETYTVPADAEGPQLWTGRPYALTITVGGRAVPRLAEDLVTMRDVPVDAASLLARGQDGDNGAAGNADEI